MAICDIGEYPLRVFSDGGFDFVINAAIGEFE